MKRILALLGVGVIVFIAGMLIPAESSTTIVETEVEVTPEWATDEEALEAAQAVIRRKALEAELNVLQADIEALETRETEIEKELGVY